MKEIRKYFYRNGDEKQSEYMESIRQYRKNGGKPFEPPFKPKHVFEHLLYSFAFSATGQFAIFNATDEDFSKHNWVIHASLPLGKIKEIGFSFVADMPTAKVVYEKPITLLGLEVSSFDASPVGYYFDLRADGDRMWHLL